MRAIRIHRCRLRLVRHGGWSWGPDPQALLQAALRALPALLAAALAGLWLEEDEREIVAPVRLRIRLRASEFLEAHAGFSGEGPPPAGSPAAEIVRRLAASLAVALAHELPEFPTFSEASSSSSSSIPAPDDRGIGKLFPADVSLPRLLRTWRDRGDLVARLALLSEAALEAWVAVMLREGFEGIPKAARPGEESEFESRSGEGDSEPAFSLGLKSQAMEVLGVPAGNRAADLRAWLINAVETAARRSTAPPIEIRPAPALPISFSTSSVIAGSRPAPTSPSVRSSLWRDADLQASALPFLLLGPLSRAGYLETLAATFAAAGRLDDLPLFAAALAFKALPPPERGWRRTPEAAGTAAACAGLLDGVSGEDLSGLARRVSPCLEPLAADLALSLAAGHEPGRPLLLAAAGDGLLLSEVDGVFPIAWATGLAGLSPVLTQLRGQTLLVPAGIATPGLLKEIDASGTRFITPVPPTRNEPWHPLRGGRAWTNDPTAPGLARQSAGLAGAEESARRFWQALAIDRPSIPLASDPALDRHLTLAAGVALGMLAWTLWREHEPVDPVLALERFGDLTARVRFRTDSVRVVVPLGRRHRDLFDHRLLDPVRDAVWLGGRTLEFGGG